MKFKSSFNLIQQLTRQFSSTVAINPINSDKLSLSSSIPRLSIFNYNLDKVIIQSKQIVDYSSKNFISKFTLNREIVKIIQQLDQLVDYDHPIHKTAKKLVLKGNNSIDVRRLIVLLIAKAIGIRDCDNSTANKLVERQCSLAEITEVIYSAHQIHRGIINSNQLANNQSIGNSVSILLGDYLLANVWKGLGQLKDTQVVELMAKSTSDFMEGQFIVETETINSLENVNSSIDYWQSINFRLNGSLLANGCQSVALLANHDLTIQQKAYQIGLNFAFSYQLINELRSFLGNQLYPITSAPVLIYFASNHDKLDNYRLTKDTIDQHKLTESIRSSSAIDITRTIKNSHTIRAMELLETLPINEAIKALNNILTTFMLL